MAEHLNLRPSERCLLVAVALVLFVVVNVWFVWPHFGDLQKTKNRRVAALKKLELYQGEIGKKAEREAEVARLGSAGANVRRQDQAIELLRAVQKKASDHGVSIKDSSRQSTRTNEFFIEQSQNVRTLSGEKQLVEFLYELGSGSSTIRVRDLTIRPDPQRHQLSGTIKLVSSYRLDKSSRPKKSNPKAATTAKK